MGFIFHCSLFIVHFSFSSPEGASLAGTIPSPPKGGWGRLLPFIVPDAAGFLGADYAAIIVAAGTTVTEIVASDTSHLAIADKAPVL